jgi:hypothetical protein
LVKARQPDAEEGIGLVLGVITGGNPREVLRLADLASSHVRLTGWTPQAHALLTAMRTEALGFRLDAISAPPTTEQAALSEGEKVGVFEALAETGFTPLEFRELARSLMEDAWSASWAGPAWHARFEEEWQKLLVRMFACSQVLRLHPRTAQEYEETENGELLLDLQRAIVMASHSAAVARLMLGRRPEFAVR